MCIVPFELVKKMYGFHDGETSGGQYRGFPETPAIRGF